MAENISKKKIFKAKMAAEDKIKTKLLRIS